MSVVRQTTPQAGPGSAIIRVLKVSVLTYAGRVYSGKKPYPYPTPFVPGSSCIARIAAVGPDATTLTVGQLVYFDCFVRGRDDPTSSILHGLFSGVNPGSTKLMENEWRDGTYAEYAKVPLENCYPLDEQRLLGSLGYTLDQLLFMAPISVPIGGLRDVGVKAGEKVIVAPATGSFGSTAVMTALAMGAQVIAVGRNLKTLEKVKALSPDERIRTVQHTGDVARDIEELTKDGPSDAFFDISPVEAVESLHLKSCIQSLRPGGRVSFMGAFDAPLPTAFMMRHGITFKGKWMYTKDDIRFIIQLAESGFLRLSLAQTVGQFALEQFEDAFEAASKMDGPCSQTIISP